MLFVGTSIIHPSTEGVFLLCNILDLLIYSYHIKYVELVDIDIKTGKYIIKPLEEKDFERLAKDGHDLNLDTWFDFDYEDCIDEKKKPIELNY